MKENCCWSDQFPASDLEMEVSSWWWTFRVNVTSDQKFLEQGAALKKQQARILSKTWIFRPCINDKSVHKVFVYKLFLASSNVKARQDDQSSYLQQCLLLLGFLTHFSISNHFSLTKKNPYLATKLTPSPTTLFLYMMCCAYL